MKKKQSDLFEIDLNRLDEEWVLQPRLYYEAAMRLADAKEELERKRAARDVVEAEMDRAVRMQPAKFLVDKITEGAVDKAVKLQDEFKDAQEDVINAKHAVDIAQAEVDTLEHKKRALENLVNLQVHNYFSAPQAPEGARERLEKAGRRDAFRPER